MGISSYECPFHNSADNQLRKKIPTDTGMFLGRRSQWLYSEKCPMSARVEYPNVYLEKDARHDKKN